MPTVYAERPIDKDEGRVKDRIFLSGVCDTAFGPRVQLRTKISGRYAESPCGKQIASPPIDTASTAVMISHANIQPSDRCGSENACVFQGW